MAFDRQICALTIFCEASSASQAEREAVAWVIRNRVASGKWAKTPAGVCLKRMQFSEWNGDAADNANLMRGAETASLDPIMQQCLLAYDDAMAARPKDDPTKGATHYTDKTIEPPAWARDATMVLETPKFRFYKDVR